jgi:hypothetical protein
MNPCPSRDELQLLLTGTMAGEREQRLVAHVEACAPCQQVLEELTAAQTRLAPDAHGMSPGQCPSKGFAAGR